MQTLTRDERAELEALLRARPYLREALHEALEYVRTQYAGIERTYAPEEITVVRAVFAGGDLGGRYGGDAEVVVHIQRGGRWLSSFGLGAGGAVLWAD